MRPANQLVQVELRQGTIAVVPVKSIQMQNDATGVYTNEFTEPNALSNIPAGSYDMWVKGPYHLAKLFIGKVVVSGTNRIDLTAVRLTTGDSNNDNRINEIDYGKIVENFGCATNPVVVPLGKNCAPILSDFDLDGDVDIFDYAYLVGNYGSAGEL